MRGQTTLFNGLDLPCKPSRQSAPYAPTDTSQAAAESIVRDLSKVKRVIWHHIRIWGGLTCEEVEIHLAISHQTASARIRDLRLAGVIRDTGERRKTKSGRQAIVWGITQ